MRGGAPDRVPVMCQLSIGHYFLYSGIDPLEIWFTGEGFARALIAMQERYGFDGILVNLPGRPAEWRDHVRSIVRDGTSTAIRWNEGGHTVVPDDDNPHRFLEDGSPGRPDLDLIDPDSLFYFEPWAINGTSYPFVWDFETGPRPKSDPFPAYVGDTLDAVVRAAGDRVSVHAEVFSPFSQFLELVGYEPGLTALLTDPEKVHACLGALSQGAAALGRLHAAHDADAVLISSAFAGSGFISRELYREFVFPYEKTVIEGIRSFKSIPIYTHTCGGIGDRLDLMMATGTNGIDTLDPPPLGTVDLDEAVALTKGKVFLKGNIDAVGELLYAEDVRIERAVRDRLEAAMDGGGFILSTACSVSPATRPAKIERLVAAAHACGRY